MRSINACKPTLRNSIITYLVDIVRFVCIQFKVRVKRRKKGGSKAIPRKPQTQAADTSLRYVIG